MKKSYILLFFFILFCLSFVKIQAQDIEVTRGDSVIYGDPGVTELVLYAHVKNISSVVQTVFLVRTENELPANWTSSLCFDVNCYPPNVDSVATTEPLQPGDSIEVSVHFYPDFVIPGTGHVQIQIGTMHNPSLLTTMNLIASTEPPPVNDIQVVYSDTVISGTVGMNELVLYAHVINVSQINQTAFIVRTQNNLPANWTSSLCFDVNCYPPDVDSVATTAPIPPGDSAEVSVHFYPDLAVPGTGNVQIQIGSANNPDVRTTINESATTEPTAVKGNTNKILKYALMQNYPNPFNPSTSISYAIPQRSFVTLKVYNITGNEIATLVNGEKGAGTYTINYNAEKLSSGIYFYKITAGNYSAVRKMILLK
jgi:hypothetical protein